MRYILQLLFNTTQFLYYTIPSSCNALTNTAKLFIVFKLDKKIPTYFQDRVGL